MKDDQTVTRCLFETSRHYVEEDKGDRLVLDAQTEVQFRTRSSFVESNPRTYLGRSVEIRLVGASSSEHEFYGEAFFGEATWGEASPASHANTTVMFPEPIYQDSAQLASNKSDSRHTERSNRTRPPFNAEYVLYLLLQKDERDYVIGDFIEGYDQVLRRFNKVHADIWFYKQVVGSLFPLLRRALLRIGALVWLGRILRRLIS